MKAKKKKGRPFVGNITDNEKEKFVKEKRSIFRTFVKFYREKCYDGKHVSSGYDSEEEKEFSSFKKKNVRMKYQEQERAL